MRRDHVAEVELAHHLVARVAQPFQLGVVDRNEHAVDVERVVAAGRAVVQGVGLFQRAGEPLVGLGDAVLRGLAVGDVDHLDDQTLYLAVHLEGDVFDARVVRLAAGEAALAFESLWLARQRGIQALTHGLVDLSVGDVAEMAADHALALLSIAPAGVAGVGKAADQVAIEEGDLHRRVVADRLHEPSLRGQRLLRRFRGGDVDQRVVGAQEAPLAVAHGRAADERREGAAVAAAHDRLDRVELLAGHEAGQALQHRRLITGRQHVAHVELADDFVALVAQPIQLGAVDEHQRAIGVERVVAAGRLVVERLGFGQGHAHALLGIGQFLGALLHALFQLGVEAADLVLLLVQLGDVARDGEQHGRLALRVADGRERGVPPLGRALEGVAEGHEARTLALARGGHGVARQRAAFLGPPRGPVAQAHFLEIVHLDQAAALFGHLNHATFEVEHLGAIGAAGDDLTVEFVLDACLGLEHAQRCDVLHEAELADDAAAGVAQRGVAHQHVHGFIARLDDAELDVEAFTARDAAHPVRLHALQVVGVHAAKPAEVGKVLAAQAEDLLELAVDVGKQPGFVGAKDADGKHAGERAEQGLVFKFGQGGAALALGVQRRRQLQGQVGVEMLLAGVGGGAQAAELLRVALAQVLVLGAQRAQLQRHRPLAFAGTGLAVAAGQGRIGGRKAGAHCRQCTPAPGGYRAK